MAVRTSRETGCPIASNILLTSRLRPSTITNSTIASWFLGRLPDAWTSSAPALITVDREEITVTLTVAAPELPDDASDVDRAEATVAKIQGRLRHGTTHTVVALAGPTGAGKTTIFNLITGRYQPTEGEILLEGESLVGLPPHQIASMGVGRTFQNLRLWRHMTVLEHVKMSQYSKIGYGLTGAFFGTPKRHREEAEIEEKAYGLLAIVGAALRAVR